MIMFNEKLKEKNISYKKRKKKGYDHYYLLLHKLKTSYHH